MDVPARYSAADDAARPQGQRLAPRLWITLDRRPISRVISYDIERGEIVRIVVNRQGLPLVNPNKPDEWLTQTVRGVVRVEWVDAKVTGKAAAKRKIENLLTADKLAIVGKALFAAGDMIKADAQHSITEGAVSGKGHVVSKPGDPPNEDTGELRRGIIVTQIGPLHVRVSATAPYSGYLEHGTSKMAARPFMGPAARRNKKAAVALVKKAVSIALERK